MKMSNPLPLMMVIMHCGVVQDAEVGGGEGICGGVDHGS